MMKQATKLSVTKKKALLEKFRARRLKAREAQTKAFEKWRTAGDAYYDACYDYRCALNDQVC